MSYQDRPVSGGPARDDPEFGDTLAPRPAGQSSRARPAGQEGDADVRERARDRAEDVAATGRERASEVAGTAGQQAREVADTAGTEAREVAREAGGQARRLARDTRDELRSQADSQVERLANGLDDLTHQLRSMGERGEPGPATDLVDQAADRAERIAERLRQGGIDDAVGQIRDFGRNRPGLFLLGAFGLGLVSGRVARNLAQEPSGPGGNGGDARGGQPSRSPMAASGRPGTAAGQGSPPGPVPGTGAYAAPAAGHEAYGAPVGDERWGG